MANSDLTTQESANRFIRERDDKRREAEAAQARLAAAEAALADAPGDSRLAAEVGLARQEANQKNQEAIDAQATITYIEGAGSSDDKLRLAQAPESIEREEIQRIKAQDPSRLTGFEGLSQGAPFYFQMPTMQAITDFRMRNGFSPYGPRGETEIARDAVHFTIFELTPPVARSVQSDDGSGVVNERRDKASNILGSFTIYPNNPDWLKLTHSHNWQAPNPLGIINSVNQALGGVDAIQSLLQGSNALFGDGSVESRVRREVDTMDTYQGTQKLSISIPFNLFTKKDFLNDVYRPLMLLTAITYPKRMLGGNLGEDIQKSLKNLESLLAGSDSPLAQTVKNLINSTSNASKPLTDAIDNAEETVAGYTGFGPYRYFVSKRPEYMSMRHASGLIYFPICFIDNISYEFKGPWFNTKSDIGLSVEDLLKDRNLSNEAKQRLEAASKAGKTNSSAKAPGFFEKAWSGISEAGVQIGQGISEFGEDISNIFANEDEINRAKTELEKSILSYYQISNISKELAAYPSMAEVTITVRNALPFFRDDWLELYNGAGDPQSLINVGVKQSGNGSLLNPDGTVRAPFSNKNLDPSGIPKVSSTVALNGTTLEDDPVPEGSPENPPTGKPAQPPGTPNNPLDADVKAIPEPSSTPAIDVLKSNASADAASYEQGISEQENILKRNGATNIDQLKPSERQQYESATAQVEISKGNLRTINTQMRAEMESNNITPPDKIVLTERIEGQEKIQIVSNREGRLTKVKIPTQEKQIRSGVYENYRYESSL